MCRFTVSTFESYFSTILERPAGFEPAFTSFVAKAINPLWHGRSNLVGELRIELRPRAPKARMQRITLFPVVPAQRVERCSLRFQRSVSTAHTRLAKFGGPCGNRTHLTILLAKQATTRVVLRPEIYSSFFPACSIDRCPMSMPPLSAARFRIGMKHPPHWGGRWELNPQET